MAISIHQGELDRADVQALLDLHVAAMRGQSPADACHVLPGSALDRPDITFLSLRDDGALVAIGALKALGNGSGEVKSMRVKSERQGQGLGRAMLDALANQARTRRMTALLLETGRRADFAAANALYDRYGFVECTAFGGYRPGPFTRFMRFGL